MTHILGIQVKDSQPTMVKLPNGDYLCDCIYTWSPLKVILRRVYSKVYARLVPVTMDDFEKAKQ